MARNKAQNKGKSAKLEMTPMIDVVFQLLIFFIVTLTEQDILANLNISRPSPPDESPPDTEMLTLEVGSEGWVLNGKPYMGKSGFSQLDHQLTRIASYNRESSVVIKCTSDSTHSALIQVLNSLSREDMKNVSVLSL